MKKDEIRRSVREQKRRMTGEEINLKSDQICERLWNLPAYRLAEEVYIYASYNQEVKTEEIFRMSLALGKRICYPRVEENVMQFYEVEDLNDLINGYQGIPEPKKGTAVSIPTQRAIFLVPGLAFDRKGVRIGYGGGFYDRYFEEYGSKNFYKAALAYEFQIYDELQAEKFDVGVDVILTPANCIYCI